MSVKGVLLLIVVAMQELAKDVQAVQLVEDFHGGHVLVVADRNGRIKRHPLVVLLAGADNVFGGSGQHYGRAVNDRAGAEAIPLCVHLRAEACKLGVRHDGRVEPRHLSRGKGSQVRCYQRVR